jgi:hypothetical protein
MIVQFNLLFILVSSLSQVDELFVLVVHGRHDGLHELYENEEGVLRLEFSAVFLGLFEEGFDGCGMTAGVDC